MVKGFVKLLKKDFLNISKNISYFVIILLIPLLLFSTIILISQSDVEVKTTYSGDFANDLIQGVDESLSLAECKEKVIYDDYTVCVYILKIESEYEQYDVTLFLDYSNPMVFENLDSIKFNLTNASAKMVDAAFTNLRERLNFVTDRLNSSKEHLDSLQNNTVDLEQYFSSILNDSQRIVQQIEVIGENTKKLKQVMKKFSGEESVNPESMDLLINSLQKLPIDQSSVSMLKQRLETMSDMMDDLESNGDDLSKSVRGLGTGLRNIEGLIQEANLKQKVDEMRKDVWNIQRVIGDVSESIVVLTSEINYLKEIDLNKISRPVRISYESVNPDYQESNFNYFPTFLLTIMMLFSFIFSFYLSSLNKSKSNPLLRNCSHLVISSIIILFEILLLMLIGYLLIGNQFVGGWFLILLISLIFILLGLIFSNISKSKKYLLVFIVSMIILYGTLINFILPSAFTRNIFGKLLTMNPLAIFEDGVRSSFLFDKILPFSTVEIIILVITFIVVLSLFILTSLMYSTSLKKNLIKLIQKVRKKLGWV